MVCFMFVLLLSDFCTNNLLNNASAQDSCAELLDEKSHIRCNATLCGKTGHLVRNDLEMDGGGFEPPKQFAADLQSVPFGHSGIHP